MNRYADHSRYLAHCTDIARHRCGSIASYKPPAVPYQWLCARCSNWFPDTDRFALQINSDAMICYPCSHALDLQRIETANRFTGYLSCDGKHFTAWPGGILGTVCRESESRTGWHGSKITHVQVRDKHGAYWHGKGAGRGMVITLTRCKGA